jgi:hypothetical protein
MTRPDTVTIRHTGKWEENRHGPSFLRPLVEGVRRRLTATPGNKTSHSTVGTDGSPSRQG